MRDEADVTVERVDHEDEAVRRRLLGWLAPHEPHALFVVGNLAAGFPGSHLYVARRGPAWAGVAGYYERPTSLCPFALDPAAARALVRSVAGRHPAVAYLNAAGHVGGPCVAAMRELGYEPANDPVQTFMTAPLPPGGLPEVPHEGRVRPIEPRDAERVAWLMRDLQRPGDTSPIEPAEVDRVLANRRRVVLEADGRVVATASTNGVGIRGFQILGVVTDERHRGRGYARAACAALMRRMQAVEAEWAVLFTGPGNEAAKRCYAGLGFRAAGDYYMAKFGPRP